MNMRTDTSAELIKVGFIGGGIDSAIGRAHFGALHLDRKFSLESGLFSIDALANKESAEFYGVAVERVYESVPQFLSAERENLDAVVILSPTPLHFEHINQVFDAGIPVISEKALCTNSNDARVLAQRVADENQFLSVTFTYTGYPIIRQIKEMIAAGEFGKLSSIHVEMPQEGFIKSGPDGEAAKPQAWRQLDYELPSVTLDLGSHVVNLAEFITGAKISEIAGIANHSGDVSQLIDNVLAIGRLNTGAQISFSWNKISLGKRNGLALRIYGERAAISWEQESPEYLSYTGKDGITKILDRSNPAMNVAAAMRYQRFKPGHPAGYIEAFANLYSDIVTDLLAHTESKEKREKVSIDSPYTHSAINSYEGLKILETLHESAKIGKTLPIKR